MWSCLHATIPPIIDPYVPSSIYKSLGAVNIGYNKYVRWFTLLGQWCILWCWCGRFVYNYVLVLQGVYRRSDLCLPPSSGKAAIGGRRSASPSGRGLNLGQEAADAGRSPADPSRPGNCCDLDAAVARCWRDGDGQILTDVKLFTEHVILILPKHLDAWMLSIDVDAVWVIVTKHLAEQRLRKNDLLSMTL